MKTATQGLVLAFLQGVFEADASGLARWQQQHAALLARFAGKRG